METSPDSPGAVRLGPLNHVALPSADPPRGARFYCEVLGFKETPRPAFSFRGSWLLHEDVGAMVHLIHDARHEPQLAGPINTRGSHFAMQTPDYDEACRRLADHGVEFVERVLPDYDYGKGGYRQAFFRDPDGNVIELGEWPSPTEMFNDA